MQANHVDQAELSPRERLLKRPRSEWEPFIRSLSKQRQQQLPYDWMGFEARPKQRVPPGDWLTWLILSGRGWGKTRTGAETVRHWVEAGAKRIILVGRSGSDVRKTMVEGESGILAVSPPGNMPEWLPGNRQLIWPNGAIGDCYSGDEPRQLRGFQGEKAWIDEPAHWQYPAEAFKNLFFGLRLGDNPQCVATTTPLPIRPIIDLAKADTTIVTNGSSFENRANLSELYYTQNIAPYVGTRVGRQEIEGEILSDVPGALWTRALIDEHRRKGRPELVRVVVAIDPAVTNTEESDDTGIIAAGLGIDGHGYVLQDATCKLDPPGWGARAVGVYDFRQADEVIGETNNGGDLVERNLRVIRPNIPFRKVTATRGKSKRAQPVATLYERGLVHHVGSFDELEDQMVLFTPEGGFITSPDRADALVWALWALMIEPVQQRRILMLEEPYQVSPY